MITYSLTKSFGYSVLSLPSLLVWQATPKELGSGMFLPDFGRKEPYMFLPFR